MLARVITFSVIGVDGHLVEVEVDIARGLPAFSIVGLPDNAVRESRDRVKAAIKNCGYEFPNRKITVNLAPADLKKEGTGFDLPIAIGLLTATEIIDTDLIKGFCFTGELALNGEIRQVPGTLPMAIAAADHGLQKFIIPHANKSEASFASERIEIYNLRSLPDVVELVSQRKGCTPLTFNSNWDSNKSSEDGYLDFAEVKGQLQAKRGLEIAASGGHNLLMRGVPGCGKTMLARRLPTILPDLSFAEMLETQKIYSVTDHKTDNILRRPFRAPHHTISDAGLIGGGVIPRPGEVSLAHNGVLFLDELPEFKKHVLEVLRQPLEDGQVTISRANNSVTFPSRFMLISSMNLCPCGFYDDPLRECNCTPSQIDRYRARISGPLLDRIDIHLEIPAVEYKDIQQSAYTETSEKIKKRVIACRAIQSERFSAVNGVYCNSQMTGKLIEKYCKLDEESSKLVEVSVKKLGLSARAYYRILKIARTIADMDKSTGIKKKHVAEAIQLRRNEPKY